MGVGLCQGCDLSPIVFVIFLDRISRRSWGEVGLEFGELRIASLLFADCGPDGVIGLRTPVLSESVRI